MKVRLFDVNLLIALAWPNHLHHRAAHRWLGRLGSAKWATCPLTQCSFVRISSNPKIIVPSVTPGKAMDLLGQITRDRRHVFWPDDVRFDQLDTLRYNLLLSGHRQVTDAYLLALTIEHKGRLATLDKGISNLAGPEHRDYVEWIDPAVTD